MYTVCRCIQHLYRLENTSTSEFSRQSEPSCSGKLTLVLLAVYGVCYTLDLEKSALLALSVFLFAKLGGSKRSIATAGIAAVMLAWFLPPNGSLTVTGVDNRLALALFVLGTVVDSRVVEGNQ